MNDQPKTPAKLSEKPLRQVQSVQELLWNEQARQQLSRVAAQHMRPERMMRLMANAVRENPALGRCEPLTLLGSLMTCASLGLEPNTVLGQCYLIPFGNKVTLIIGYKGMIDLARRSGHVVSIHADVVYAGDDFDFEYGSNQHLRHVPRGERGTPEWAYCHAKLTDGEAFIVYPYAEVLKIRDASQAYKRAVEKNDKTAPWIAYEHQMARKTMVRALFNELPISVERVNEAMRFDDRAVDYAAVARGGGREDDDLTIDGSLLTPDEEPAAEEAPVEEAAGEPRKGGKTAPSSPKPSSGDGAPPKGEKAVEGGKTRPSGGSKAKQEPEPAPEPEPESEDDEVPEEFQSVVSRVTGDLDEARTPEECEQTMELFEDEIALLQEKCPVGYQQVIDYAEGRKGELK